MNEQRQKKVLIKIAYWGSIAILVYFGIRYLTPLFMPFILSFLIVWLLKRPSEALTKWLKIPNKVTHVFLLILFYALLFGGVFLGSAQIISVTTSELPRLPVFYHETILPALNRSFDSVEKLMASADPAIVYTVDSFFGQMTASLGDSITSISKTAISTVSNLITSMPSFFIKLLLMVVSSFFFATDYQNVTSFIWSRFSLKQRESLLHIKTRLTGSLLIYVRSYALLLLITFTELLIGLWIIGIPYFGIIAALISIFDLLPILGTGGIIIPWAIIAFVIKDVPLGVGLMVMYLFITIVRNTLEPKLVGKQIGLHPLATLISLFIGGQLFGIIGLFGLPVALSLIVQLKRDKLSDEKPTV